MNALRCPAVSEGGGCDGTGAAAIPSCAATQARPTALPGPGPLLVEEVMPAPDPRAKPRVAPNVARTLRIGKLPKPQLRTTRKS